MKTFYELSNNNVAMQTEAVFCIHTNRGNLFMCVSRTPALNEERFVVEVDANKFLDLWRNTTNDAHFIIAQGTISEWKNDRKFIYAEDGFLQGQTNPVPLADVSIGMSKNTPYINICDGITRTIYLLSLKAEKFPVECYGIEQAQLLQKFAGLENGKFKSVQELIPSTSY